MAYLRVRPDNLPFTRKKWKSQNQAFFLSHIYLHLYFLLLECNIFDILYTFFKSRIY